MQRPRYTEEISARAANEMSCQLPERACHVADANSGSVSPNVSVPPDDTNIGLSPRGGHTAIPPTRATNVAVRPPNWTAASSDQALAGTGVRNWWHEVLAGPAR